MHYATEQLAQLASRFIRINRIGSSMGNVARIEPQPAAAESLCGYIYTRRLRSAIVIAGATSGTIRYTSDHARLTNLAAFRELDLPDGTEYWVLSTEYSVRAKGKLSLVCRPTHTYHLPDLCLSIEKI